MNAITDMIMQKVAGSAVRSMAAKLGLSEAMTEKAVQIAVPLLIAALARNASQPAGADALNNAVAKDHDGSIFDNILGAISDPQAAGGGGILGHVLGTNQGAAQNEIAAATGMDSGSAGGLLEMLAPMVMGSLGQTQRQDNLDAGGLAGYLNEQTQADHAASPDLMGALGSIFGGERAAAAGAGESAGGQAPAEAAQPDIMSSITSMLDSDKDGSVTDDVGNILGKLMK